MSVSFLFLAEMFFNLSFTHRQIYVVFISLACIVFLDGIRVYLKWYDEIREENEEVLRKFGKKKYK